MSKRRKNIKLAVVALLLLFLVVFAAQMGQDVEVPIFVQLTMDTRCETIRFWERQEGEYFVFLPGYADLSKTEIGMNTSVPVRIDNKPITEGMCCDWVQLGVPYDLTYNVWGKEYHNTVVFMKSGGIATMHIDTETGSMDYIHEKKGNEESGTVGVYTEEGNLDYVGEIESINGRGNNTWEYFDKKAYSLKLHEEANLLGMGSAQKWILLANADDSSNMRNKIAYDFADQVGLAYSPDSQWVDVYLNGEYSGLYLLCERNELHPERIDIATEDSFVVSLEKVDRLADQNYTHIITEAGQALRIHYPEKASDEMLATLSDVWQSVENAILAEDEGERWLEQIDMDSWVKKYLIEEIFANVDGCFISQFFYYDGSGADGKIYAGPVWDYDHTLGNRSIWAYALTNTFFANRLHVKEGFDAPWFHALYQKEVFYNQMIEEYKTVFLPALEELLNERIRYYTEHITQAAEMDHIRWSVESDGMLLEMQEISDFLEKRIAFLNDVWLMNAEFHMVKVDPGFGAFYPHVAVYPGECVPELPKLEASEYSVFVGWYDTETDMPVDFTKPITEDIEIYAKWEDSQFKRIGQIGKLTPLGIIAVMGVVILIVDIKRMGKSR